MERRCIQPPAAEWVEKAEGDYHAAGLLFRARKHPNYDASCFHAPQCAEKYMKAVLYNSDQPVERIHDLAALLDQLRAIEPAWEILRPAATLLSVYAVRFRYPGASADRAMAREASAACDCIRPPLRTHLGLRPVTQRRGRRRRR